MSKFNELLNENAPHIEEDKSNFDREFAAAKQAERSLIDVVHTLYGQIEPAPDLEHTLQLIEDMLRGTPATKSMKGHSGVYKAVVMRYPAKPSVDQSRGPTGAISGEGPGTMDEDKSRIPNINPVDMKAKLPGGDDKEYFPDKEEEELDKKNPMMARPKKKLLPGGDKKKYFESAYTYAYNKTKKD